MVAAVAVAKTTKPLNDSKPEFSHNVNIETARNQKIFGTVKSFKESDSKTQFYFNFSTNQLRFLILIKYFQAKNERIQAFYRQR